MRKKDYTQGVCDDGVAILCDGIPMNIEEILFRLRQLEKIAKVYQAASDYRWATVDFEFAAINGGLEKLLTEICDAVREYESGLNISDIE